MAVAFPATLDSLTNPASTDTLNSPSHAGQHSDANDAIEAIQAKLGVDSSAVATSLDYLVKNASSSNPGHKHTLASGATDITASVDELNIMDGVTANKDEINVLDGVTAFKDENDMASDSDSSIASQQSIKAYVTTMFQAMYPVGSIYTNASVSTNPATLLGFGTWAAFGSGKVLVGLDSGDASFDTLEETGGSKTANLQHSHTVDSHTHTLSSGYAAIAMAQSSPAFFMKRKTTTSWTATQQGQTEANSASSTATTVGADLGGSSGAASSSSMNNQLSTTQSIVQPYIVVYMWKRTA